MQPETVEIEKIVNGGYGFARRADGQVVLVRHVLPGETVTISIGDMKKNCLFAEVRNIVSFHRARRDPPCPYFGKCGGCDLQHCDYSCQLQLKKNIVTDLLQRSSALELRNAQGLVADPIPGPEEFAYRQRLRLQVGPGAKLGFHSFQSHTLIPINACLLARDTLNETLIALRKDPEGRKLISLSSEVELQENPLTHKTNIICKLPRKPRSSDTKAAIHFAGNTTSVERIFFTGDQFALMGPYGEEEATGHGNVLTMHYSAFAGLPINFHLQWEARGFCQVNLAQNRALIATVLEFCQVEKGQRILDLYCGMGNFSIPLGLLGAEVLGIEGQASAIRSARINAARAGLIHAVFRQNPIHTACTELLARKSRFDCVIIDPPRQGAPDLGHQLAALSKSRLVYISCDPATLCRDLAGLMELGFSVRKIQPVDMFPQTHHIETVVLLEKLLHPSTQL